LFVRKDAHVWDVACLLVCVTRIGAHVHVCGLVVRLLVCEKRCTRVGRSVFACVRG